MNSCFLAVAAAATCFVLTAHAAFADTPPRSTVSLNADWRFHKGDFADGAAAALDDRDWERIDIPHTWNARDGQDGGNNYYRGPGWYRRKIDVPADWAGRRIFLRFGAANIVSDAYLDGRPLGQHRGGFAAYCYDITTLAAPGGSPLLAVRVDNARVDDVPPLSADFTFCGGIYRDVTLLATGPLCISPLDHASPGVYLRPLSVSADAAEVEATTVVHNGRPAEARFTLETAVLAADGAALASTRSEQTLAAGAEQRIAQKLRLEKPRLWNGRRDPYLHTVRVRILEADACRDEVTQPLGLRSFRVDPEKGFELNGQPYPLHGVCRHQDRADQGWALAPRDHEQDFELICELGCTMVRLAHYQHDDYAYTLADRAGLVVWAEIPLVDQVRQTSEFRANAAQQLTELIRQNYNHPSICFWGIHNEITAPWAKGPEPADVIRELNALARREDPSRLTTCAATDPVDHPANWQTDVTAFNRYFGWYGGQPEEFGPAVDAIHKTHPKTPLGVSEYGAGASIQHHVDPPEKPRHDGPIHPEEWQAHLHESHWRQMNDRPYLWCTLVWVMFDFASDGRREGDSLGRNDKGLVTGDRRVRKDAFYWYKSQWSRDPFVHIASRRYTPRAKSPVEVRAYSNCSRLELFVNGESRGVQTAKDGVFGWDGVPLRAGENQVRVTGSAGEKSVEDACMWQFEPGASPSPAGP